MNPPSSLVSFSRIPQAYIPEILPSVAEWRWVASIGFNTESPIRHPQHQKWIQIPGNTHSPMHREIMLTLHGENVYGFNGKVYRRRPGTLFLFDHQESRDFKGRIKPQPYCCLWIHLMSQHFYTYNTVRINPQGQQIRDIPNGRLKSGDSARLLMNAWDYCKEHPDSRPAWELLKTLVSAACLEILTTAEPNRPDNHHEQIISAIRIHIRDHLHEDLSLNRLSEMAGYSSFFFHRLFAQHTGQTPKHYVDMMRLEKAKELLKQNYTVESVSEAVGMSSAAHLGAFFKKYMKRSPGQWRRVELS